ncbi:sulfatase-like hydrolase/transferase [Sphingobacterium sp. DK4209]|uniref:Sulfatase-like hydrolase/transferase n=1 Tax=Sphingobacterium zhuxiongii TaxID=2662364 RepID=A0A5Q0QFV1_9SPHI|nr:MULTISPECIES: sulfatase [unclassified Sphingobacterium]MVZ65671.1 sulfatase-like hydrolase/transferase [Sphingobacterium sp. DK4209]QGA27871.1 sulfatase-like hydrolase/transferase [Sphingobacterium sp. dk4302]
MRILLSLIWVVCGFVALGQQKKPNIVIIISDDHSYQTIGAYGAQVAKTPQIDRLAKQGAVFTNAYVNNSICGPSRATLLTGKYSHKNGFKDNETSVFDFSQNLFVKELQHVGYHTSWIGKIHLGEKLQGFDYYDILVDQGHYFNPDFISKKGKLREHGYVSDLVTDKALNWLDTINREQPFCLVIGHKATHRTWMPDPKDFGTYDQQNIPLPASFYDDYATRKAAAVQEMSIDKDMRMGYDLKMFNSVEEMMADGNFKRMDEAQKAAYIKYYRPIFEQFKNSNLKGKELAEWKYRRYMIDYLNTAQSMDRNIGRVLDYLQQEKLEENTIVIYLSDQGFYMGEHGWFDKRFMYEESFRTPMIMRKPGLIPADSKIQANVVNADIAPTLLELAGIAKPDDMQGKSFLSVLNHTDKKHRDDVYYHYFENGEHAVSPHFGVKSGRYKLIRFYKRVEAWELFDMEKDPKELKNLASDPSYQKVLKKMKKKLLKQIKAFDDPQAEEIFKQKIT